jgi:hypothetical protein
VAEDQGASAHLIINPAAGSAAMFLGQLTREPANAGSGRACSSWARTRGSPPSRRQRTGRGRSRWPAAMGRWRRWPGWRSNAGCPTWSCRRARSTTSHATYFARDLGLVLARPLRALDALHAGHERRVDVGRLNGRPFINNVSLGVYAQMLADPGYRQDKLRVAQRTLQAALSDPTLRKALRVTPPDGAPLESVVAMVVSNNRYEYARWDRLGQRERLDAGTLQVSVLDAGTLDELERLLGEALRGVI